MTVDILPLRVEGIAKRYRGELGKKPREVLRGVSFFADRGEILGFLGPNGAGKTTTIKIILGLIRAGSGEVEVFGEKAGSQAALERIGYLPENPFFYQHLSLREFLRFCGDMSGLGGRELAGRVEGTIGLVGLEGNGDRRLNGFSKGMLQRAGLAQAVLHDPDLLILDEPFSGLDPMGRKTVREILLALKERGKTIFFSSHIMPDMEALCDRTVMIRDGKVARCVGMDELLRMAEGPVDVTVRRCSEGTLDDIRIYIEETRAVDGEVFMKVKKQEFVRTVIQHLYNRGAEIIEVRPVHASLEDLFIREVSGETGPGGPGRRSETIAAGGKESER